MIRHWVKIILLALLILVQTACPKFVARQSANTPVNTEDHNNDGG